MDFICYSLCMEKKRQKIHFYSLPILKWWREDCGLSMHSKFNSFPKLSIDLDYQLSVTHHLWRFQAYYIQSQLSQICINMLIGVEVKFFRCVRSDFFGCRQLKNPGGFRWILPLNRPKNGQKNQPTNASRTTFSQHF